MLSPHGDLPHGQGPTASHKGLWRLAAKLYRPKHFQDIHAQAVAHQGTLKYIGNTQMHGRSSSRVQVLSIAQFGAPPSQFRPSSRSPPRDTSLFTSLYTSPEGGV